jgi:hypothetical protein
MVSRAQSTIRWFATRNLSGGAFYLLLVPLVVLCYFNVDYYKRVRSKPELRDGPNGRDAELGALLPLVAVS